MSSEHSYLRASLVKNDGQSLVTPEVTQKITHLHQLIQNKVLFLTALGLCMNGEPEPKIISKHTITSEQLQNAQALYIFAVLGVVLELAENDKGQPVVAVKLGHTHRATFHDTFFQAETEKILNELITLLW